MTAVSNALALLGAVFLSQEGISHGLVTNLHLDMRKAQNIINSSYFRVGRGNHGRNYHGSAKYCWPRLTVPLMSDTIGTRPRRVDWIFAEPLVLVTTLSCEELYFFPPTVVCYNHREQTNGYTFVGLSWIYSLSAIGT